MNFDPDQRPAKLYLLFLLGVSLLVILYTVAGFWVLPHVAKSLLEKHLAAALHRPVTIERIAINPYELSFAIKNLTVRDQNATANDHNGTNIFLAFDELYAVVQGGSLVERALILREVKLSGPYVSISRKEDGRFNFSDLLEAPKSAPEHLPEKLPESASKPDSNASLKSSMPAPEKPQIIQVLDPQHPDYERHGGLPRRGQGRKRANRQPGHRAAAGFQPGRNAGRRR